MKTPAPSVPDPFQIGEWLVEPSLNRVSRHNEIIRLQPRVMQVLMLLASRHGEVVGRDELMETVWRGVTVNEESLTRSISTLRQVLRDTPQRARYIETIPKRGYRLLSPARHVEHPEATEEQSTSRSPVIDPITTKYPRSRLFAAGLLVGLVMAIILATTIAFRASGRLHPPLSESRPLSSYLGEERCPALSPDGTRVAFSWGGEDSANYDIYIRLLDSEPALRLTDHPGHEFEPAWSPDGTRIIFMRLVGEGSEIYSVPSIGGPVRLIHASATRINSLDWSPDGRHLVLSVARGGLASESQLALLSLQTNSLRILTDPETGASDADPAFSPSGTSIAFSRNRAIGTADLLGIDLDGGNLRVFSRGHRRIRGIDWLPDRSALLFSTENTGVSRLWYQDIDAANPQLAPSTSVGLFEASTSASGGICCAFRQPHLNIHRLEIKTNGAAPRSAALFASTRFDSQPACAPDGERIAFVSSRSGSMELWVGNTASGELLRLTHLEGPTLTNPQWSPDGQYIGFSSIRDGWISVFVIPAPGGVPERISPAECNARFTSWSRDGQWLYYATDLSGNPEIWRMRINGDDAEQMTKGGGITARESWGGTQLFFMRPGDRMIRSQLIHGDNSVEIGIGPGHDYDAWSVGGRGIYLVRFDSGPQIALLDPRNGTTHNLARLPGGSKGQIALSPDERFVLFTLGSHDDSDLLYLDSDITIE